MEAWPSTRHADRPWHEDEDLAAFLAASRGVFDLYSDELRDAEVSARASLVRCFPEDTKRSAGFGVTVLKHALGGFEAVHVAVPARFHELGAAQRARACLDVIDATMKALAQLRRWDTDRLDEVRRRVEGRGLRFTWAGNWKTSPGRRHQARAVYWLDDEGHGQVQLEVRRYADHSVIARSEPALAFMTVEGFKRSAATLRWHDTDTVTVVPWTGLLDDVGLVQLSAAGPPAPPALPPAVPPDDVVTDVATTVRTGEEWQDDPDLPWLHLEGDMGAGGAYGAEFHRTGLLLGRDAEFARWWAQTPFRSMRLSVCVPDPEWRQDTPKAGARKYGKDLILRVVTEQSDLPPTTDVQALKERARADLHGALVGVATARKLPSPPPLPARVHVNARQWRARAGS